jgi:hypothetical protein
MKTVALVTGTFRLHAASASRSSPLAATGTGGATGPGSSAVVVLNTAEPDDDGLVHPLQ